MDVVMCVEQLLRTIRNKGEQGRMRSYCGFLEKIRREKRGSFW